MKRICFLIFFIFSFAATYAGNIISKPDSVTDSWSLTYNGKEILAYTINGISTYLIDSINDNSFITIDYYTEVPCEKCQSRLQLKDEDGKVLATIQKNGFGTGDPFKLPGRQFRELMHNHKMFLFFSANPDGWGTWVFLGMVKTNK
ncbi:MAG: hypothetical protein ACLQQ4_15970 [Bacteroidia bacterium]